MSYLRYQSARTHELDPYADDDYPRPLVRRNSKRQRLDLYGNDEHDDYPYTSSHSPVKPSRALTIRRPSQIEKYNVWSHPKQSEPEPYHSHRIYDGDDDDRTIRYKYSKTHYAQPSDDDVSDREREFRLRIRATFGRPKSSHSSSHKVTNYSGDSFKRREKFVDEDWMTRERQRGGNWWDEQEPQLKERTIRYRRIKRTRTDEWKPLSGWRR